MYLSLFQGAGGEK